MRINKIKKKLKTGELVFGTMIKEAKNINISRASGDCRLRLFRHRHGTRLV